jgi:hypothetical protein
MRLLPGGGRKGSPACCRNTVTDVGPSPKSGLIRSHLVRWKMRRGRWICCAFTRRSGTSFRTRLACSAFRQVGIRPDFAVPIYPGHLSLSVAEWHPQQGAKKFKCLPLYRRNPPAITADLWGGAVRCGGVSRRLASVIHSFPQNPKIFLSLPNPMIYCQFIRSQFPFTVRNRLTVC